MSKDVMPSFELFQPNDIATALSLLDKYEDGWKMAGGQDTLDWLKDRNKHTSAVIDLNGIAEMKGIKETADGIEIGALTPLVEIANNPIIREKWGLLSTAAGRVASPQIRNIGTIGGNVNQDARCWYYRSGLNCYRAGGTTCYADTPQGMNREHCLFEASRCVAVSPSDTAPCMVALDASMVVHNSSGEKVIKADDYFIGPATDIRRMTVLEHGDILTKIRLPNDWAGAKFYFEKVADRNTWDFPLVNIASAMKVGADGMIQDMRIVCGAVQARPRRLTGVEQTVKGSPQNEETAALAARVAAQGAVPLNYNHFKIPLMENLVKRAVRDS